MPLKVKPFNAIEKLEVMLRCVITPKNEKRALRFALHVIANSEYRPRAIAYKNFPFWRFIAYTSDGCADYQCLNCKETWDARTPPGELDWYEECDKDYSTFSYVYKGITVYSRKLSIPEYRRNWKYCPCCNIEWDGPVVMDQDNEQMLGFRRKCIQEAIYRYHETRPYKSPKPDFYWVLEYCEPQTKWIADTKFKPVSAKEIKAILIRTRKHYKTQPMYFDDPDTPRKRRYRIKIMKNTKANQRKLNTLSAGYT